MRILHCADIHLSFVQFTRVTRDGENQRSADVAATFVRVIDRMIELEPDAIVIAGDVFHFASPSNAALVIAVREFSRLLAALPSTPVIIAGGNHDIPKTRAHASILQIFATLGVHVADLEARRFDFASLGLSVLAVPDVHMQNRPELNPDPAFRYNAAVIHGEADGVTQGGALFRHTPMTISRDELAAASFDYVALGHYHRAEEIAPNAWYSGSIEYTSTNPYEERLTPKGFIERDLATGAQTFHAIAPARPLIDLPPIDATGLTAANVDALIAERMATVDGELPIVRLVVDDITTEAQRALDAKAIRRFRLECLNLNIVYRRVVPERRLVSVAIVRKMSVDARAREYVMDPSRAMAPDVNRVEVAATMQHYLDLAKEKLGDASSSEPDAQGSTPPAEFTDQTLLKRTA